MNHARHLAYTLILITPLIIFTIVYKVPQEVLLAACLLAPFINYIILTYYLKLDVMLKPRNIIVSWPFMALILQAPFTFLVAAFATEPTPTTILLIIPYTIIVTLSTIVLLQAVKNAPFLHKSQTT